MNDPGWHYRRADALITEAEKDYAHPLHSKRVELAKAHAAMAALPVDLYLAEKYPPLPNPSPVYNITVKGDRL